MQETICECCTHPNYERIITTITVGIIVIMIVYGLFIKD